MLRKEVLGELRPEEPIVDDLKADIGVTDGLRVPSERGLLPGCSFERLEDGDVDVAGEGRSALPGNANLSPETCASSPSLTLRKGVARPKEPGVAKGGPSPPRYGVYAGLLPALVPGTPIGGFEERSEPEPGMFGSF
jgi:hypothetical protein